MTERTTTEIVERIEQLQEDRGGEEAHEIAELFIDLDAALTSGSPLPAQWPQATEIEELRTKVAKLEKAIDDRRTVEGWALDVGEQRSLHVTLDEGNNDTVIVLFDAGDDSPVTEARCEFTGSTPDEAFSSAAEWVRGQG